MELQAGLRTTHRSRARNLCRHSSGAVRCSGQEGLSAVFLEGRACGHRRFTAAKAICSPFVGAAYHLWTGAADCVRKPRQPDAREGKRATARNGGSTLTLGASRLRLIRQLLAESLLLALGGAAIGVGLAQALGRILIAYIGNTQDPVFLPLYPDLRVLSFTFGVALLTCVLFGVAPAIQAANADPGTVMKASGRGLTAGRERFLLRRGLIVSQVALSLVLMVAALLFVRTFRNLLNLDVGFRQNNVLVADFDFSSPKIAAANRLEYKRELLEKVRNTPGVIRAAETTIVPLNGDGWNEFIDIPSLSISRKLVYFNAASTGYFQTLPRCR